MDVVLKLWPVFYHTLLIYLFLIMMVRFLSRRQFGQLSVIDLVIVLILGSAVETDMIAGNTSLEAGLVSAMTLLLANRLLALILPRYKWLRSIVVGSPVLLIHNGKYVEENMRKVGMTHANVLEAIREREKADVSEVKYAVLESDGTISLIPIEAPVLVTPHGTHIEELANKKGRSKLRKY